MARRTFRLLKDSPELKKGALLQEKCDAGDQDYGSLHSGDQHFEDQTSTTYTRMTVEESPAWFVEVFPVLPEYATKEEIKKFKAKRRK